jgi:hypothetical protein
MQIKDNPHLPTEPALEDILGQAMGRTNRHLFRAVYEWHDNVDVLFDYSNERDFFRFPPFGSGWEVSLYFWVPGLFYAYPDALDLWDWELMASAPSRSLSGGQAWALNLLPESWAPYLNHEIDGHGEYFRFALSIEEGAGSKRLHELFRHDSGFIPKTFGHSGASGTNAVAVEGSLG